VLLFNAQTLVTGGIQLFNGCTNLTHVTFNSPNYSSVDVIASGILDYNTSITTVVIQNGYTSIEPMAFSNCTSLTSITIPSSVTSIGDSAFSQCTSLTSITIPSSVTSIKNSVFSRCTSLTSITIPSSVTSIEEGAFAECSSLTSITIPSSVTSIGNYAFVACTELTSATYYDTTTLGTEVFGGCTSLSPPNGTVLTSNGNGPPSNGPPSKVTPTISVPPTTENSIFPGQPLSDSILIGGTARDPSSNQDVSGTFTFTNPNQIFSYAGSNTVDILFTPADTVNYTTVSGETTVNVWLQYIVSADGQTITGYNGNPVAINNIQGSVRYIAALAFSECTSLTTIRIPFTIESIGGQAFGGCTSLTSLTFLTFGSSGLTSIDQEAFIGCTALTSVTLPAGIPSLGSRAFKNCTNLTSVTYYDTTTLGTDVFSGCTSLSPANGTVISTGTTKTTPTLSALSATSVNTLQTLTNSTLSGTPSVAGTLAFTNPSQALVLGSNSVGVTFTPTNTTLYNNATATVTVTMTAVPTNTDTSVTKTINNSPVALTARSVSVTTNATSYTPTDTSLPSVAVASLPAAVHSMTIAVSPPTSNAVALVLNAYDNAGEAITTFASPATFTVTIPGLTTPTATVNTYNTNGSIKSTTVATNTSGSTYTFQLSHLCDVTITGITPPSNNNIPCFPTGVQIKTASGLVAVEELATGDLVLTADGRQVPVKVYSRTLVTTEATAPYVIPKNSLGPRTPVADLHLSPLHAFQVKKGLWQIPQYAAKQTESVCQYGVGETVTYYHVECPNFFTDNLVADGCVVESFGGKQIAGLKTVYTYNSGLKGFTRAATLNRVLRA
jgi:hypothetical protein